MNGAEILVKTAVAAGIEVCFANAGTTEMGIVRALDEVPGIRAILGLFEGVCTGAADGYGRMAGKPALSLLHLGPGLANGIANLHNGRRSRAPLLNIVGEHATWHLPADAPLTMDIESLASTVSGWLRTNLSAETLSRDTADAIGAAMIGQVATLIVPSNHQQAESAGAMASPPRFSFELVDRMAVDEAAGLLRSASPCAMLLGGKALSRAGLRAVARIRAATGCDLFCETFPSRVERGAGLPPVTRIPYFPDHAEAALSRYQAVVLAGAREPVTFFGYEGCSSYILGGHQRKVAIGSGGQDEQAALELLADALDDTPGGGLHDGSRGRGRLDQVAAGLKRPDLPKGTLTAEKACAVLAALQPEEAIIMDEALTSGGAYFDLAATAPPHTYLALTGGAIGQGIPCATGAAVACPDRPVINFQADGSGMYTLQGLWTQAREGLNVTTLICSNRSYRILNLELERAGVTSPGRNTRALTTLGSPPLDWVKLGQGMGVPSVSVATAEDLARELAIALKEPGPHLIEMIL
jgi:acetolactate synthase-1/2/3 large subunit